MQILLLTACLLLNDGVNAQAPLTLDQNQPGTVHVSEGGRSLFTLQLTTPREMGGGTIRDEAFVLGEMVVVIRGAHYPHDGQCVNPGGDQLEIFGRDGRSIVSKSPDHIAPAHGNRFAAPSGRWGVTLEEEAGRVYGFLLLEAQREPRYVKLPELEWHGLGQQWFTPSDELVLPNMVREGKRLSLIISPDGSFRLGAP
jgi:hypothetical protein